MEAIGALKAFAPDAMMLGKTGFKAYHQRAAGYESQEAYNEMAAEEIRAGRIARRTGRAEQHEMLLAEEADIGKVKAAGAKSGVRGGSVVTLTKSVQAGHMRQRMQQGEKVAEQIRGHKFRAGKYIKAGRGAKTAAGRDAFVSLLTGGLDYLRYIKEKGKPSKKFGKLARRLSQEWLHG